MQAADVLIGGAGGDLKLRYFAMWKHLLVLGLALLALSSSALVAQSPPSSQTKDNAGPLEGVDLGKAFATATFNSVNVYVPFTERGSTLEQEAQFRFKKASDSTWTEGLPLWASRSTIHGSMYSGAALMCEPGTRYDLEVIIRGTKGGQHVVALQGVTRAEDIPAAATLVATHFVRTDGSDKNPGTSNAPGGAWATIRHALRTAPSGAVVQVGSGAGKGDEYFADCGSGGAKQASLSRRDKGPITLFAPFPAVDDQLNEINVGKRTIIEGGIRAAPSGQTVAGMPTAPWKEVTLTGPLTGDTIKVWKWPNALPGEGGRLFALSWGAVRNADMKYLWKWDGDSLNLNSAEAWAEFAQGGGKKLQLAWHYGYFIPENGKDVYALMPPNPDGSPRNPNDYWWGGCGGDLISLNSPDSRVTGFVLRNAQNGVHAHALANKLVVDHNDMRNCFTGVRTTGDVSLTGYSSDIVCQYNKITMRGLRAREQDPAHDPTCQWGFVKQRIKLSERGISVIPAANQFTAPRGRNKGKQYYKSVRVGGRAEGTGMLNTASRRTVFRYNLVDGLFNGFGAEAMGRVADESKFANSESDCHDNIFLNLPDDAWEPARGTPNVKFWNNRGERTISFMSTGGPSAYGPLYAWNNVFWRIGNIGITENEDGSGGLTGGDQEGYVFKYDGTGMPANPRARFYFINNTCWSDDPIAHGGSPAAGEGRHPQAFWMRNNIFRVSKEVIDWFENPQGMWNEDYNHFAASDAAAGFFEIATAGGSNSRYTTLASYREASRQGAHTNVGNQDIHNVAWLDNQLANPTRGDLTLKPKSALRGIGVNVPNIRPTGQVNLGYDPQRYTFTVKYEPTR